MLPPNVAVANLPLTVLEKPPPPLTSDQTMSLNKLSAVLKPYDPALMEAYAVNRAVNSVKNDTEECIEPVAD